MSLEKPFFKWMFIFWTTSILMNQNGLSQNRVKQPEQNHTFSDEFYFGGLASVGTCFFGPKANDLFAPPFLAKGGLCLTRNYLFFEASATFLNGRQKSDFQLAGQDYLKNDRYTFIGAQTNFGYWVPVSNNFWIVPTIGLSYHYFMPGNKERSDSKTIIRGPVGCPGFGLFIGKKLKIRSGDQDSPHIEIPGLRYEIIWPGINLISQPIHQVSFSIIGLLSKI